MNDSFIYFEYGLITYQQWGIWRWNRYREAKSHFIRETKFVSRCPLCKSPIKTRGPKKNYTIDHIIPIWVIHEYGLFQLEFDHRNWRVICETCNGKRGREETTFDSLTLNKEVKDRLIKRKLELS